MTYKDALLRYPQPAIYSSAALEAPVPLSLRQEAPGMAFLVPQFVVADPRVPAGVVVTVPPFAGYQVPNYTMEVPSSVPNMSGAVSPLEGSSTLASATVALASPAQSYAADDLTESKVNVAERLKVESPVADGLAAEFSGAETADFALTAEASAAESSGAEGAYVILTAEASAAKSSGAEGAYVILTAEVSAAES